MENIQEIALLFSGFVIIALASRQIGNYFAQFKLPLISGFLFAGILIGPFVLNLVTDDALPKLRFIDEISLAIIAFAAGSELYLKELKSRIKSIGWITGGNVLVIPLMGGTAVFLLADFLPFMNDLSTAGRISVSLLAGAILVARSPSSIIAIVNELRAKGPFTQTVLGVTMVTDVIVIILFAVASEIANALLSNLDFSLTFIALLLLELGLSLGLGYLTGKILEMVIAVKMADWVKISLILLIGFGVFFLSSFLREWSDEALPVELLLEPLLICMIGSFWVINYTLYRADFLRLLHELGPPIYVAFFTLTGASLALDVLADTWLIALIIFIVRLLGIFTGSYAGGTIARDPTRHNLLSWMGFVTQAGVGLGLAKEVAVEFPTWGPDFATLIISVIVMSQIMGPPFMKWGINRVGESHARAEPAEFDGVRDAVIFGLTRQSVQLARQLQQHDWQVKIATRNEAHKEELEQADIHVQLVSNWDLETLCELDLGNADSVVALLSDEVNYQLCELIYEHFGTETVVVQLNNRENAARFHELGVLIVEPQTAVVSLLEHFVRSPVGVPMLLGMDGEQDVVDIEVRNPDIHGLTLRDLRLPLDVLVLSVNRGHHTIISHGYTRLRLGDKVTMVGSVEKLEEVMLRFDA